MTEALGFGCRWLLLTLVAAGGSALAVMLVGVSVSVGAAGQPALRWNDRLQRPDDTHAVVAVSDWPHGDAPGLLSWRPGQPVRRAAMTPGRASLAVAPLRVGANRVEVAGLAYGPMAATRVRGGMVVPPARAEVWLIDGRVVLRAARTDPALLGGLIGAIGARGFPAGLAGSADELAALRRELPAGGEALLLLAPPPGRSDDRQRWYRRQLATLRRGGGCVVVTADRQWARGAWDAGVEVHLVGRAPWPGEAAGQLHRHADPGALLEYLQAGGDRPDDNEDS